MVGIPAAFAAARVSAGLPDRLRKRFEKSTFPIRRPIGGIRMSLVNDATILPNAAPMMTPTARSSTLPLLMNSLNSLSMEISLSRFHVELDLSTRRGGIFTIAFDAISGEAPGTHAPRRSETASWLRTWMARSTSLRDQASLAVEKRRSNRTVYTPAEWPSRSLDSQLRSEIFQRPRGRVGIDGLGRDRGAGR